MYKLLTRYVAKGEIEMSSSAARSGVKEVVDGARVRWLSGSVAPYEPERPFQPKHSRR